MAGFLTVCVTSDIGEDNRPSSNKQKHWSSRHAWH
jgi:hypothetical protein